MFERQTGCLFWDRCAVRMGICDREEPQLLPATDGGAVACFFAQDAAGNAVGSAPQDAADEAAGKGESRHAGV